MSNPWHCSLCRSRNTTGSFKVRDNICIDLEFISAYQSNFSLCHECLRQSFNEDNNIKLEAINISRNLDTLYSLSCALSDTKSFEGVCDKYWINNIEYKISGLDINKTIDNVFIVLKKCRKSIIKNCANIEHLVMIASCDILVNRLGKEAELKIFKEKGSIPARFFSELLNIPLSRVYLILGKTTDNQNYDYKNFNESLNKLISRC